MGASGSKVMRRVVGLARDYLEAIVHTELAACTFPAALWTSHRQVFFNHIMTCIIAWALRGIGRGHVH